MQEKLTIKLKSIKNKILTFSELTKENDFKNLTKEEAMTLIEEMHLHKSTAARQFFGYYDYFVYFEEDFLYKSGGLIVNPFKRKVISPNKKTYLYEENFRILLFFLLLEGKKVSYETVHSVFWRSLSFDQFKLKLTASLKSIRKALDSESNRLETTTNEGIIWQRAPLEMEDYRNEISFLKSFLQKSQNTLIPFGQLTEHKELYKFSEFDMMLFIDELNKKAKNGIFFGFYDYYIYFDKNYQFSSGNLKVFPFGNSISIGTSEKKLTKENFTILLLLVLREGKRIDYLDIEAWLLPNAISFKTSASKIKARLRKVRSALGEESENLKNIEPKGLIWKTESTQTKLLYAGDWAIDSESRTISRNGLPELPLTAKQMLFVEYLCLENLNKKFDKRHLVDRVLDRRWSHSTKKIIESTIRDIN